MRKLPFTDKELGIAAEKVMHAYIATLPDPSRFVQPFEYSPEFQQKIERLIKEAHRKARWQKAVQRVASIMLAILIGGGVWLAVDVEARAAFVTWVREVYEDSFVYRYFVAERNLMFGRYEVTSLPDDYVKCFDERYQNAHMQKYDNGKHKIAFVYYPIGDGVHHTILNYSDYTCDSITTYVNGNEADIYCSNSEEKANIIVWIDESAEIAFEISAYVSEIELVKLAESVLPTK